MKFEYKPQQERPYVYIFDPGWEVRAIAAAFGERVTNKFKKSSADRVKDWEAYLASCQHNEMLAQALGRPEQMTDVLDAFVEDTDDALTEIYRNGHESDSELGAQIGRRILNGRKAGQLSGMMLEAAALQEMKRDLTLREMSIDEQVAVFSETIPEAPPDSVTGL